MNVSVKHNGTTISSYVIEYTREHKICTGIGQLEITLSLTYPTDIVPWDTIDIYENGSFQVKYYVSSVSKSQPDGVIRLECQDKSKRLIDYFIPDQYTITYPSYTGYWIKKFLTEAGVSYSFSVPSTGKLLSNYTNLGLAPAYEQILTLLQLSGWYMFFDGNGIAKIGTLTSDFSNVRATYNRDDILEISKITDDKMLRNRAVVWGSFDASRNEYAYADVKTNTRWNYDRRDYRTMVVSNGNIQDKSSAYGIANTLIKEFARATVEKHLIVAGAAGRDLGDVVRVRSNVYNGSGLITTYGVSMSKSGLVTNMVLDERCPRLFGFFDFGDWVYVGTYGDGVWRKHLKYDPTWYNFSTGLESDLAVTDLHINNEVFGAITASGGMHYALSNDGPWQSFVIDSLTSSFEASIQLGPGGEIPSGVEMTIFSGLMGRATIVDKLSNAIKYGVDTYSGINYGDYFMMYSGMFPSGVVASGITSSGISSSGIMASGYRGWIVEYDPFTLVSGVYPISISGNFNIQVIDLENDGLNDYVSVASISDTEIEHTAFGYNFGKHLTVIPHQSQDSDSVVAIATMDRFSLINMAKSANLGLASAVSVFDNESINEREIIWHGGGKLNRYSLDVTSGITSTTVNSPSFTATGTPVCISKISTNVYRVFTITAADNGTNFLSKIYYNEWDVLAATVSSSVLVSELAIPNNQYHSASYEFFEAVWKVIDDKFYVFVLHNLWAVGVGPADPNQFEKNKNRIYIYEQCVDVNSSSEVTNAKVFEQIFHEEWQLSGPSIQWEVKGTNSIKVFQNGNSPAVVLSAREWQIFANNNYRWIIYTRDGTTWQSEVVLTTLGTTTGFIVNNDPITARQLTGEHYVYAIVDATRGRALIYNGSAVAIESISSLPWYLTEANMYSLFGTYDNYYIAKNGTDWYFCNPQTFSPDTLFVPPTGYTIIKPYSTTDSTSPRYYWQATDDESSKVILQTTESAVLYEAKPITSFTSSASRAFIAGNFMIDAAMLTNTTANIALLYLDNRTDIPSTPGTTFMVLQRDGADYHLIQQSAKPIRVDISNSAPLLTVQDNEDTFKSHYIFENEILTIHTSYPFGLAALGMIQASGVRDYRYTMLEVPSGVEISSGVFASGVDLGAEKLLLYNIASGVNFAYTNELASGFTQIYPIPSGSAERIETSNFCGSGQYVFVTTSGESPSFFQKDPMSEIFESFPGLPISRATIIRLDDRI